MSDGGAADRVVDSTPALRTAFERLSSGDTIHISAAGAPYRTSDWLDVDVDDVAVVGPGIPGLVQPAHGADTGGIRIGHHGHCENVLVRGFGFGGNRAAQRARAPRCHGIAVRDADGVTLAGNDIRRTHPRRHGDGGSGISVAPGCDAVRVVGNRVRDAGDRGIQVAGSRLVVAGNDVRGSLDRAISADLWYPDGEDHTARHALVTGNVLGDSAEGSLTGLAHNAPVAPGRGHVAFVGNVGYGAHKSFCHVRGPEPFANVAVRNNLATQETAGLTTDRTTRFAGVAADAAGGHTLVVRNNTFRGYSGPGVNVDGAVRNAVVAGNTLVEPARAGVRVRRVDGGTVAGNAVVDPGTAGIRLVDAADLRVGENRVRAPAGPGIDVRGGSDTAGHDIVGNHLSDTGGGDSGGDGGRVAGWPPAIRVCDHGVRVRGNSIHRNSGPGIIECADAGDNRYEANRADGEAPWRITSPTSRARDNAPPLDVHRGLRAEGGVLSVTFDRTYARAPRLSFGRRDGAVREVSYRTGGAGNVVGADIVVGSDGTFDVFVDPA